MTAANPTLDSSSFVGIGEDIGHSSVKISANGQEAFPAAAIRSSDLGDYASEVARPEDTVMVGGEKFFVGNTAVVQSGGRVVDGLSDDWVDSDEHKALLVAGYKRAEHKLPEGKPRFLGLGLPSRLYSVQKHKLRDHASVLLGLPKDNITILPQPLAAFYSTILDSEGKLTGSGTTGRWYVIDVGYYTTDFGCMDNSTWSAAGQESSSGMYVAAQSVRRAIADRYGLDLTVRDADHVVRTKTFRDQGNNVDATEIVNTALDDLARLVIDSANRVFGPSAVRSADGVCVAGGGSPFLLDSIHKTWRHAKGTQDARFAVAEGLRRFALVMARTKQ